jgi:hypothetical protein
MYHENSIINHSIFTTNSRHITTPSPRVSPGNQHAAPIMLRMVGAASCLSVYLCVSRAEPLLMVSNTSYPKRL